MRILALIAAFLITGNVFACECIYVPLVSRIQISDLIAKVKVVKVTGEPKDVDYQDAEIEILELYKGNKTNAIKIHSGFNSMCRTDYPANSTWVVFANKDEAGNIVIRQCSGSMQLDQQIDAFKYPNAASNLTKTINRKVAVLEYFKTNNLVNPNEYHLELRSIEPNKDHFKGFQGTKDDFAVYEITVEKNLALTEIKALKAFGNKDLSDSLWNYLQSNKNIDTRKITEIKKRTKLIVVFYFYPSDKTYESFISIRDV